MSDQIVKELVAEVGKWDGIQGRIADIADVLNSLSYKGQIGQIKSRVVEKMQKGRLIL